MKTYVNTSLMDAHNAQMQLEQIENIRLKRAGTMEVYGKFLLICSSSLALLMFGFGVMVWLMSPAPAPANNEYVHTYEISEVVVHNADSGITTAEVTDENGNPIDFPGVAADSTSTAPSLSDSLAEIQVSLADPDGEILGENIEEIVEASQIAPSGASTVIDAPEATAGSSNVNESAAVEKTQSIPSDEFVVFRTRDLPENVGKVVTGLKYQPTDLSKPFTQYCYWSEDSSDNKSTVHNIGIKTDEDGLEWDDNPTVEQYKELCQFLST